MELTGVEIDVPTHWERRTDLPGLALFVQAPEGRSGLRSTVTVTDTSSPDLRSFDAYVEAQLAGLHAMFGGTLIHLRADATPAPRLELAMAFEHLGYDCTSVQHHLFGEQADGRAVVANATAADADWAVLAPALVGAVRSVRNRTS